MAKQDSISNMHENQKHPTSEGIAWNGHELGKCQVMWKGRCAHSFIGQRSSRRKVYKANRQHLLHFEANTDAMKAWRDGLGDPTSKGRSEAIPESSRGRCGGRIMVPEPGALGAGRF